MKKVLSIVFAMLILFSGMHISVASHFCGGEIAAVKWSVTGEKATCGMEKAQTACPLHQAITSGCCKDEVTVYKIDNNYSPSDFQLKKVVTNLIQVFNIPDCLSLNTLIPLKSSFTCIRPPGNLQSSSVKQEDICVFLI